ncbi:DUF982 domain-containing protein [Agrobacterium fabrum]|uniref:DUF982 domain-containing protein n=1 Tax=Agrobacterium fabrum TaxID=1176649 RepID=UPI000EF5D9E5|nr:DUF982 domain-containing protein [Agrobacterium fabrum]AYM66164.1 hypothetical protein At12D13_50120 [Agrobacterium fabrum]NTE63911.1 DUF982 domain-containing protein [Agrobacterium fabrum]
MTDENPDHKIVPLQIEWGSFRTLSSVVELADCLMREWPGSTDGAAYITALMVCDAVLSGGEDDAPEHAREAFVEAAFEAGLSIFDEDNGPDF